MDEEKEGTTSERKIWSLCKMPFWQTNNATTSSSSSSSSSSSTSTSSGSMNSHIIGTGNVNNVYDQQNHRQQPQVLGDRPSLYSASTMALVTKSLLPTRRRLRLDPPNKLYFPYEPGKQVRSAIGIKNTCKSNVAFKFQTTAPKSCYMRPPGGILAPGESLIATVFKFVEPPENNEGPLLDQKMRPVKFKIVTLKVKGEMEYVPEMFDEQKDQVAVEQILRVVFLDPERPCLALEKLKRQLAEAEAEMEARKKPPEEKEEDDGGPRDVAGEGLVIDEWKERRERYLARQQQTEDGTV